MKVPSSVTPARSEGGIVISAKVGHLTHDTADYLSAEDLIGNYVSRLLPRLAQGLEADVPKYPLAPERSGLLGSKI